MKAIAIEASKADIIAKDFPVLMYLGNSVNNTPELLILTTDMQNDAPSKLKMIETVVESGKLILLKILRRKTLAIITDRNMIIISEKANCSGRKIPFLATSIIPPEKVKPNRIPQAAAPNMNQVGIDFEAKTVFRELSASILTLTIRSETDKRMRTITSNR
jgi:hypothetical protein